MIQEIFNDSQDTQRTYFIDCVFVSFAVVRPFKRPDRSTGCAASGDASALQVSV
jgi:hypothetical protein